MVELSYTPYWSRNYVEAQAKGNQGGVIVLKIQNRTLGIGEARQISSDIRKAKKWLDEQWQLKCTEPDGDSYWDSSEVETHQVTQPIVKSKTQNNPDELEIL
jgi:aconitase B